MQGRRNPFVAREGIPFLLLTALACGLALRYLDIFIAVSCGFLFIVLYLLFRDPRRQVPASPLGVVSPVDGRIVLVDLVDDGPLQTAAHRIRIEIDSFGTYTARAPIEGSIMDLHSRPEPAGREAANALWLQTDEGDDVVLHFPQYRLGLAPQSFVRYGERVGQGQRCAYLRLARYADVYLPAAATVQASPGQPVVAGSDLIGKVPHP